MKKEELEIKIQELKNKLALTDYKCLEFVDGFITAEEYDETRIIRNNCRNEINSLEQQLKLCKE